MSEVPVLTLLDGHTIPQLGFGVFQIPPDETEKAVATALEVPLRCIPSTTTTVLLRLSTSWLGWPMLRNKPQLRWRGKAPLAPRAASKISSDDVKLSITPRIGQWLKSLFLITNW